MRLRSVARMRPVPYFLDVFPRSRRPEYPRAKGEIRTTVAIIGGGLTGCATAASFASAGIRVVLLESDRIGAAATAGSSGLMRQDFDAFFQQTEALHGLRTSRHLWQGLRRSALDFSAALRRLSIRADLAPQDLVLFTRDGAEAARRLQREHQARRDAGIDASWLNARAFASETAITGGGAIRTKGEAFDPYRACLGLAAAAAARGTHIHERSPAQRIRAGRKTVEIKTDGAVVTADAVVIATSGLPDDLRAPRRHSQPTLSYGVVSEPMPAAVRREVGKRSAAIRDTADPPHLLRWLKDERVLFSGGAQPLGPARAREKALVPQVNELMYELTTMYPAISGLQPEWGWDVVRHGSPDGLPVIGAHRNFPRHLFALGHGSHGAAVSWLAARV